MVQEQRREETTLNTSIKRMKEISLKSSGSSLLSLAEFPDFHLPKNMEIMKTEKRKTGGKITQYLIL